MTLRSRSALSIAERVDLLKIDRTRYDLAVREADARIVELQAQLTELKTTEANTTSLLEIEKRAEKLAADDLARDKTLFGEGRASQLEVDQRELEVLRRRTNVRNLENTTSLIPSQREALTAKIAVQQTQLESAKLDVANTTIQPPFNCRISEVDVERGQYVQVGQVLVEADGIDVTEVVAQLQISRMRNLIQHQPGMRQLVEDGSVDIAKMLHLDATVASARGGSGHPNGRRVSLASTTRLIHRPAPSESSSPSRAAISKRSPGGGRPLVKGMFVEVELRGTDIEDALIVPAVSLHGDTVFIVDQDKRLKRMPVEVRFVQGDFAVIQSGLEEGTQVLVTDPVPAVIGMLLDPRPDAELEKLLVAQARGKGDAK